ncbi:trimeric porin PorB [Bergeriella denitrificans]|uniref:Porin n=2 Tax=Bergeriella denitrificans TaxID=494 RepID=A0A378UJB7_BERDE|nr:trimeric porin PorB [Bergeriella denitrificans]STZ77468.1 porin [Bergeriella denitrificans]
MKKSLIALTLAALPVAAMADVTLYGQIKAGVEVSRTKANFGSANEVKSATATEIADFGSRIGFKGHEHLGNNLNAIWQLEQNTSIAGTNSGWGTRESFIGLEGGFGKVRAGRLNSIVKDSTDSIDPWESSDANAHVLSLGAMKRVDERLTAVRYDTPVFGGFSASAQFAPRDNQNPNDRYAHEVATGETYFGGLNYENSGFFGRYAGGYRKHVLANDLTDGSTRALNKDGQVHRLILGYDANNLMVSVAGQFAKNWDTVDSYYNAISGGVATSAASAASAAIGEAGVEATEVAGTAAYRFGNVTPRVSYAHGFKAKVSNGAAKGTKLDASKYNQVIIGADYDFSKRTTALVSAGWMKAGQGDNKVESAAGLVGLRHKF